MNTSIKTKMNTSIRRLSVLCIAAVLGGVLGLQTCPGNEVVTSLSGPIFTGMTNLTFGYSFIVGSQPISVTDLGIYDPTPGNGLNFSHDVGLWDLSSTALLGSVNIPSGTSATLQNGFWYEPITAGPVSLAAGGTYVLGAQYNINDTDLGIIKAVTTTSPEVTFGTTRNSWSFTLAFPINANPSMDDGYFGPNALFTVVPEPATGVTLGLGLLTLAWSRRSRR
jgi:hypothetical protein